jgi:hypothetical protein
LNRTILVTISLLVTGSLYTGLGFLGEVYGGSDANAVICENGECRVQFSNSSGTFTVEGPVNKITPSMTPLESALFDLEMELFDREMD